MKQDTYQVERRPVEIRVLFSEEPGVNVLEDFVESELADTLHRVPDGGRGPTQEEVLGSSLLLEK